jgi:hypothetical protein
MYNTGNILDLGRIASARDLRFSLPPFYTHNSNRNIRFQQTLLVLGRTSINNEGMAEDQRKKQMDCVIIYCRYYIRL